MRQRALLLGREESFDLPPESSHWCPQPTFAARACLEYSWQLGCPCRAARAARGLEVRLIRPWPQMQGAPLAVSIPREQERRIVLAQMTRFWHRQAKKTRDMAWPLTQEKTGQEAGFYR